ncbi:MAG: hypothetical protein IH987_20640 [Planctomycetes bacterium]|nr:hypothetical protein [Planctomycetota bacterium]
MDSLVQSRIRRFLRERLYVNYHDTGAVMYNVRKLARVSAYALDQSFGESGLACGPESRVACMLVNRAFGRSGDGTSLYAVKQKIEEWIRLTPPMGA